MVTHVNRSRSPKRPTATLKFIQPLPKRNLHRACQIGVWTLPSLVFARRGLFHMLSSGIRGRSLLGSKRCDSRGWRHRQTENDSPRAGAVPRGLSRQLALCIARRPAGKNSNMDRASTRDLRDRDLRDRSTQLRKYSVELRSNAEELIKHVDAAMKRVHSRLAETTAPVGSGRRRP